MIMAASKKLSSFIRFWLRILCHFCVVASVFTRCDARSSIPVSEHVPSPVKPNVKHLKILEVARSLNMVMDVSVKDSSNPQPYVSSPFSLPPYDSLSPMPLPNTNNPPFCVYPPPQQPSTTTGSSPTPPSGPNQPLLSPPSSPARTQPSPPFIISSPPNITPGPPESTPSPFVSVPNPPYFEPSPPSGNVPSPPEYVPSPVGFAPSPPIFQPPVVFPPPIVPPPPSTAAGGGGGGGGQMRVWCVAKPSVPDPIIREAMNYACGSGADCGPIQPNGSCFQPNKLLAHASYAFNSYWQRTKVAGGTCDFGGTAILVTLDPSFDGCHFVSY